LEQQIYYSSQHFKVISLVFDSVNIAWTQMAEFGEFFGIPSVISNIFVGFNIHNLNCDNSIYYN